MNDPAATLFTAFEEAVISHARRTASQVRKIVPAQALTPEQHRALDAVIRAELEAFVGSLLGTFDNVGGALPDGILGYRVLACPCDPSSPDECEPLAEVDIREDEDDYADTWQDFLASRTSDRPRRP